MKNIFTTLCLLFPLWGLGGFASAQEIPQHEISAYGMGGLASLHYQTVQSSVSGGGGGGGGLGYAFFFNPQWGVVSGIEFMSYGATVTSKELRGSSKETYINEENQETQDLYFNSAYSNYEEKQRTLYLQIPIMASYQIEVQNQARFYAAAGAKLGFALSGTYSINANELVTDGYFPQSNQSFSDMTNHGFMPIPGPSSSGETDFGLNLSVSVEMGMRWLLVNGFSVYTGIYLDYGVTNILPTEPKISPVSREVTNTKDYTYTGLFSAAQPDGKDYVEKANLFSAGLKVKLAFDLPRKKLGF